MTLHLNARLQMIVVVLFAYVFLHERLLACIQPQAGSNGFELLDTFFERVNLAARGQKGKSKESGATVPFRKYVALVRF